MRYWFLGWLGWSIWMGGEGTPTPIPVQNAGPVWEIVVRSDAGRAPMPAAAGQPLDPLPLGDAVDDRLRDGVQAHGAKQRPGCDLGRLPQELPAGDLLPPCRRFHFLPCFRSSGHDDGRFLTVAARFPGRGSPFALVRFLTVAARFPFALVRFLTVAALPSRSRSPLRVLGFPVAARSPSRSNCPSSRASTASAIRSIFRRSSILRTTAVFLFDLTRFLAGAGAGGVETREFPYAKDCGSRGFRRCCSLNLRCCFCSMQPSLDAPDDGNQSAFQGCRAEDTAGGFIVRRRAAPGAVVRISAGGAPGPGGRVDVQQVPSGCEGRDAVPDVP